MMGRRHQFEDCGGGRQSGGLRKGKFKLLRRGREFSLLFGFPSGGNGFAKRAWVFAIEGAGHCLGNRTEAQIIRKHRRPRDGLEQRPVGAHRCHKGGNHQNSGTTGKNGIHWDKSVKSITPKVKLP